MAEVSYESYYGLVERPFSLTPDPKYFFRGHAHGRALDALTFGLRRRDPFLSLTGDLGIGKTTVCRTLLEQLRRRGPAAYLRNALLSARDFERLLLEHFGVAALDEVGDDAVVLIDEAHTTPGSLVEVLTRVSSAATARGTVISIVFASQPTENQLPSGGLQALDPHISTRARLLPFGREDCASYVAHRVATAGSATLTFAPRAIDVLFALSGGVPRLVNLLCERALQEGAAAESRRIEPAHIERAASALELLRARPKRFRWFHKQVS